MRPKSVVIDAPSFNLLLGPVYRAIETHLMHQAGCTRATAKTGCATLNRRFGSALNLNIHFHMLFVDGVYFIDRETPVFRRQPAPRPEILEALIHTISERVVPTTLRPQAPFLRQVPASNFLSVLL